MNTMSIPIQMLEETAGVRVQPGLLKSIRERGVLVPILVTRQTTTYRILDGRRRVQCARELSLPEVPGVVLDLGGAEVTILAHATRSDNPLAELQAIRSLMAQGLGEREIARAGHASIGRIRRLAKLNRLAEDLSQRVEQGEIPPGLAFQIAGLPLEAQKRLAAEEKITGEKVRQAQYARTQGHLPAQLNELVGDALPATLEETLATLSPATLDRLLAEIPATSRYSHWRERLQRVQRGAAAALSQAIPLQMR